MNLTPDLMSAEDDDDNVSADLISIFAASDMRNALTTIFRPACLSMARIASLSSRGINSVINAASTAIPASEFNLLRATVAALLATEESVVGTE